MNLFKDVIEKICKEDVYEYYIKENHCLVDSAKHFDVSNSMFIRVLKHYDIHKDHKTSSVIIKQVKLDRYGDANYNNREKAKETCLEKYGVDNVFKDTEKITASYINKFGVSSPMKVDSIKEKVMSNRDTQAIMEKARKTYEERTGYDNPRKNPDCIKKMIQTKIKNGVYDSPGTSNIEKRCEKILRRKYPDLVCKYRDSRYARESGYQFECDFYIPSEDLFIELNAFPTHNNRPFLNTDEDKKELKRLQESNKQWDINTANTWSIGDKEKIDIAKQKHLNYIILYPTNTIHKNKLFNDKKYSTFIEKVLKKLIG